MATRSPQLRPRGGAAHGVRRWSLRTYFALLFGLFVVAAGSGAVYVFVQADRDARASAAEDAGFSAETAATQLAEGVRLLRATTAQLAQNPGVVEVLRQPELCSLTFGGSSALQRGHIDVLRPDGTVVCSSRPADDGAQSAGYGGEEWLEQALRAPVFLAPAVDSTTGEQSALSAAPIPGGRGVVVAFAALEPLGAELASLYGGGRPVEFVITSRDGETVIARSLDPARWIGASIGGTAFARERGDADRRDLDGTPRLYGQAAVPDVGWTFWVGEDKEAALAAGERLRNRQLWIILAGLAVVALIAALIYRRVAVPIVRLGAAVRSTDPYAPAGRVPVAGPAEVADLAADINGLIGSVGHELAERQRAEESARTSEQNYRLLFETSPLPMCICDVQTGAILEVNGAAVAAYGHSREELLTRTIDELVAPDDRPTLAELLAASQASERLGPVRQVREDGAELEMRITSHPVTFRGRPARFMLMEDVGERERFERRLRQSQRLESLGQLAGGISHDFNNALGVIIGFASFARERVMGELAMDDAPRDDLHTSIVQIEEAARHAAGLTRQLLAFARRELVEPTVVDVNEVLASIEPMLKRSLGERVELTTAPADELWPIEIDRGQLEQVLVNLAVNARDAMPDGGELTIDTDNTTVDAAYAASRPGVAPGRYVRLRVSDTGVGMDERTIQRAFEPFFTTKPLGTGTGLGLATVYGIVTQAGGRAQIYSEPGHGTTFTALLPVSEGAVLAPAATEPAADLTRLRGGETVLVVEDEDALREVTARMLRRYGYRVLTAADGVDALELVSDHQADIDLLVTDVVMPRMLGREVAERVAELKPGIRVLYISGYAEPVLGSRRTLEPGVQLLGKPFSEPVLLGKVREVLDAPAGRASGAERASTG